MNVLLGIDPTLHARGHLVGREGDGPQARVLVRVRVVAQPVFLGPLLLGPVVAEGVLRRIPDRAVDRIRIDRSDVESRPGSGTEGMSSSVGRIIS